MSKSNKNTKRTKKKSNSEITYIAGALGVVALVILICAIFIKPADNKDNPSRVRRNGGISETAVETSLSDRLDMLKEKAFSTESIKNIYSSDKAFDKNNAYTVFISLCDAKERATVLHESASELDKAWDDACKNAIKFEKKNKFNTVWVKADIVDSMERTTEEELKSTLKVTFDEFYRKGISLDDKFKNAYLEAEINGNKIIDYDKTDKIDKEVLNKYLATQGRKPVNEVPKEFITFTCRGFMCDEKCDIYELYGYGDNNGLDYGRRITNVDRDTLKDVVLSGANWLSNELQDGGRFNYGYYPTYDRKFSSYNILRHATGILPLVWDYNITGDKTMKKQAKKAMDYMLNEVDYKSKGVAYVKDSTNSEIKLGGNGLAIIVTDIYMDAFGKDDKLIKICEDLGEGMLELQNSDGSYYHVLDMSYNKKEQYRTVYYDGEATYGFCVLYKLTGDQKWLDAAQRAVDNFIKKDYVQYRDHWVAYAMNEITKYIPKPEYFDFGLKNLKENMDVIYKQKTTYHTYMELIMAGFEMYDRMIKENIQTDYLKEFDGNYLARTIQRRAEHMLNGYLYPEYAMYLKNPEAIVNTFCVRHDGYRIRIDDVDHFVAGYNHYYQLYDDVQKYMEK